MSKNTGQNDKSDVVKTVKLEPHAGKVNDALSRIGYSLEEAIADLVDNSIDAGARGILIRFVHDGKDLKQLMVADDGHGMDEEGLLAAMRFGSRSHHGETDLGKFGMGLKTAALSQGRSLTVASIRASETCCCRWTKEAISEGWNCEILERFVVRKWISSLAGVLRISNYGTVVMISDLDHLKVGPGGLEKTLQLLQKRLSRHLGLVFHRFIGMRCTIRIDAAYGDGKSAGLSSPVLPIDPFGYGTSGAEGYPKSIALQLDSGDRLTCQLHVWPPNTKAAGYVLGGGSVNRRQGFYFYRNNRLIQAGGWNKWRDSESEPHMSLARIAIDLPPALDAEFRLNVQKSALDVPESFRTALGVGNRGPLADFISTAERTYRKTADEAQKAIPVPGRGFASSIRSRGARCLAGRKAQRREVNIVWETLEPGIFFAIDIEQGTISLNERFRKAVLQGARSSANDAPLVKVLIFMIFRDDLSRQRTNQKFQDRLDEINELLMLGVNETTGTHA